jgi:6-pyruvoyltetrahydropterin/6-carboxytetrahydropterin synthase
MWELTKTFHFDAAHTLSGTTLGAVAEEVHGHSFRAEIAIEGRPDPATGMVMDFGRLDASIAEVRRRLDHKLLNKIETLGQPTLENLARFIYEQIRHVGQVTRVTVYRDSCNEACTYRPNGK